MKDRGKSVTPAAPDVLQELKYFLPSLDLESHSPAFKHSRICSQCMRKVPKPRKPPRKRENIIKRQTREELCQATAHDHSTT